MEIDLSLTCNKCDHCNHDNHKKCEKCNISKYQSCLVIIPLLTMFLLTLLCVFLLSLHWFPVGLSICFSILVILAIIITIGSSMSEVSEIEIKV